MSSLGRFWIGPSGSEELFYPDGFSLSVENFEIAREGRVANGDLVIDVIATKKRFTIAYTTAVGQDALDELVAIYDAGVTATTSLIIENADSTTTTYTCKFWPFSRVRMLTKSEWLWNPVTFVLEEV